STASLNPPQISSVRAVRGNQWMFRIGHPADQPLRVRPALFARQGAGAPLFPILCEATPVRADLTHSGWSDIFFLGMDYPAGARVLNISVDLAVRDADHQPPSSAGPKPPIECYFRVIDQPIIRLVSVDLGAAAEVTTLAELFDFGKDYTGLLKAALIAAGREIGFKVPVVVRLEGTNVEKAREILKGAQGELPTLQTAVDLTDAAKKVVAAVKAA
ncbi:MAG TPA: hypothetical protein PKB10_03025, partial [Tepidisphaeraceae bacterium]|nr:hypothetical protein [Tepidisphaeraceae bacterium]